MTLGSIIKKYRVEHQLSMDAFSQKSGISKAYISLLEKNQHPKTGKAIAPSIQCIKQAADGMNMDFNILFSMLDGDVTVGAEEKSAEDSINSQNKLDIANDIEVLMHKMDLEKGELLYEGEEIDPEAIDLLYNTLEMSLRYLKAANKKKNNLRKDGNIDET